MGLALRCTAEAAPASGSAPLLRVKTVVNGKDFPHDDTDKIPVKALRDDIQRKIALKKVMGPQDQQDEGGPGSGRHPEGRVGDPSATKNPMMKKKAPVYADKTRTTIIGWVHPTAGYGQASKLHKGKQVGFERGSQGYGWVPKESEESEAVPSSFDDDPAGMDDLPDDVSDSGLGMGGDDDNEPTDTPDTDLMTKEETNYRYSGDKAQSCGSCAHYVYPGACHIVAGLIRAVDVCDEFEAENGPSGFDYGWNPDQDKGEEEAGMPQPEMQGGLKRLRQNQNVVTATVVEGPASSYGMVAKNAEEDDPDLEVTPPGFEPVVKSLKGKKGIDNPWAVAWAMKGRGVKPAKAKKSESTIQQTAMRLVLVEDGDAAASPFVTGGPGSGRHAGGKFAPEHPESPEDKQIAAFTRREKPGQRAQRVAGKKVDPQQARAIRRAFSAENHRPDYGTFVIPPLAPEQKHAAEVRAVLVEYSPDQARDAHGRFSSGGGKKGGSVKKDAPSRPLSPGAQKAQHVAQVRKAVIGARISDEKAKIIADNLRRAGLLTEAILEMEAALARETEGVLV
jgi:hypothetical protein